MSIHKRLLFYTIMLISVAISLYDIFITVKTIIDIHETELNPIAKKIIFLGTLHDPYHGVALLVTIKAASLCFITMGTSIFHYSKSNKLNKILWSLSLVLLIEQLLVLRILTW